ncbi:putative xylanase/chitin deacetylase [Mycobacterium tuberculosis]|nr:putative xylanase/chitin deacetylase [Mycobacterium tuberculosis]
MTEQQPWLWDEPTWRGHVQRVRAGRPLRPRSWPGEAKVAVALSFDSDHETIPLRDGELLPGKLSQGEYGARVGVPRILKLLERFEAPSTFFMPAVSALLHDGEAKSYADAGHEVALHGWIHERNTHLPAGVERDLAFRAADTLERLTGTRPAGIRTPSWDFSSDSLGIIRELGLTYDSSLMADDDCYEILADGEPTGIVELPVEWIRDDMPYFMMERFSTLRPYTPPRGVLSIWRDEFDGAYAEGGIFQLTLHPHCIGHRSRVSMLTELLEHIASHEGVWFATHAQIADHVLNGKGLV